MRRDVLLLLVLGAGAFFVLRWRKDQPIDARIVIEEVQSVADMVADTITQTTEKVAQMFATTKSTRENEVRLLPLIQEAEARYSLPPRLLQRVLHEESRFRSDIISGALRSAAGALGIAQIIPRWHPGVDPLDVPAAIDYAASYLRRLGDRFGQWSLALAAYNWGQGNVARRRQPSQWPAETRAYVRNILDDLRIADAVHVGHT